MFPKYVGFHLAGNGGLLVTGHHIDGRHTLDLIVLFLSVKLLGNIVRTPMGQKVYSSSLKDADWFGLAVTD